MDIEGSNYLSMIIITSLVFSDFTAELLLFWYPGLKKLKIFF